MRVVLFYAATIGFAGGIFLRSFFDTGLPGITFFILLSFVLGLIWRRNSSAVSAPYVLTASVFLLLFALGALRMEWASWSAVDPVYEGRVGEEVTLEGTVVREPDARESTTHLYVDVGDELVLAIADRFGSYEYGDRVTIEGELQKPEAFETDLGREFNYPGYLRARGVSYMLIYPELEVIGSGEGNPVIAALLSGKHAFMERIESLMPEPQVGLAEGLLLGVKRALGGDLEKTFRETGIIHIVVLSGYNVMLVVAFVTYLLGVFMPIRFQLPFGLAAIAAFAIMVGLSATVVRASIMGSIILFARASNRSYLAMRGLLLAGAIMLIINPYLFAFDTGFQLSFLATMGLIVVAPHIEARLLRVPNSIVNAREFLTATLATQLFVLPILLYQIGEFSVVSVIVNVLVLPMVPVAMFLTFITGILGFLSSALAGFVALLTYFSLEYILTIATWFGSLPFAAYAVPPFPFFFVPVAYALMGYLLWRLQQPHTTEAEVDELPGWVIEEEAVVRTRIAAERSSAATDVPVFFRKS